MHTVKQARPNILLSRVANTRCDDQQQQLGPTEHFTEVINLYSPNSNSYWVEVLRPTQHKTVHFGDVLRKPISWLSTEETKPNTTLLQALQN